MLLCQAGPNPSRLGPQSSSWFDSAEAFWNSKLLSRAESAANRRRQRAEYEAGSEVFVRKIRSLESTYRSMRRTRGDGNCFFRWVALGWLQRSRRLMFRGHSISY